MKHVAYEYAKRGARLALVARREDRLQAVADKACKLGSPEGVVVHADVSKVEECKRFVNETVKNFGRCECVIYMFWVVFFSVFNTIQYCVKEFLPICFQQYFFNSNVMCFPRKSKVDDKI